VNSLQYYDMVIPITYSDGPSTIVMKSVHRLCLKHEYKALLNSQPPLLTNACTMEELGSVVGFRVWQVFAPA